MAPFPQNRSCGRETPCKSSFPLWHGRPVHRLHRRDNENRRGKRGFSPCGRRGIPPRRESCSVRYPWPVLCCTVTRVFAPACAVAAAGGHPPNFRYSLHLVIRPREKGRYWRFVHLYYTKMRPPCKEKRGKNRCPPSILCSRPPGYTRPPFSSGCTKGRPIGEMPCGGIPHAGMCGVAACSASACARWVW